MGSYRTFETSADISLALKDMHISGNVIPSKWYRTIVNDKGKPNITAITVLSEIVFLYRPYPCKDESGQIVGYKNKVRTEFLRVTYRQFEDKFGFSKDVTRASLDFLKNLGVIDKIVRTEEIEGVRVSNVLNIVLYPKRLSVLTFGDESDKGEGVTDESKSSDVVNAYDVCFDEVILDEVADDAQTADGIDSISCLEKSDELVAFLPPAHGKNTIGIDIYNNIHTSIENDRNIIDNQSSSDKNLESIKERICYSLLLDEVDEDKRFLDLVVRVLFYAQNLPDKGLCTYLGKGVSNLGVKDRLKLVGMDEVIGVYKGICSANVRITDEFKYYLRCLYNEPEKHRFKKKNKDRGLGFKNQRQYDFDELEKQLVYGG